MLTIAWIIMILGILAVICGFWCPPFLPMGAILMLCSFIPIYSAYIGL